MYGWIFLSPFSHRVGASHPRGSPTSVYCTKSGREKAKESPRPIDVGDITTNCLCSYLGREEYN